MRGLDSERIPQAETSSSGRYIHRDAPELSSHSSSLPTTPFFNFNATMIGKRKNDTPLPSNQSRLSPEDGGLSMSSPDGTNAAENYPRKRIAIAVGHHNLSMSGQDDH